MAAEVRKTDKVEFQYWFVVLRRVVSYVNSSMHHFHALKENSTYKLVNLILLLWLVVSFLLHIAM